ncbi:MAG: hypothetical protein HQK77_12550 [Desulfobacterales bacterium]|nr:hypothetical protein [Desulfobacterales bacterium]
MDTTSRIIETAKQMKNNSLKQIEKIKQVIIDLEDEEKIAKATIKELEIPYCEVLADQSLGINSESKIIEIRSQINKHKQFISDIPFIINGLENKIKEEEYILNQSEDIIQKKAKYDEIKEHIRQKLSTEIDTLKIYAQEIGLQGDCQRFIRMYMED